MSNSPTQVKISSSGHRFRFFVAWHSWLGCDELCVLSFSSLRVLVLLSLCRRVARFVASLSSCRLFRCSAFFVSSYCFLRVVVLTISPSSSIRRRHVNFSHQVCSHDHNKLATRTQVVSILKEAIAKIEDDDKCCHQQQSMLSPTSESFSEAVERDLK